MEQEEKLPKCSFDGKVDDSGEGWETGPLQVENGWVMEVCSIELFTDV